MNSNGYESNKPGEGKILGIDHVTFWVGNAKQAAYYYCYVFGFKPFAYKGLETGNRDIVSHVIRQNDIIFEFQSALNPDNEELGKYLAKHGDSVKDIAFKVQNIDSIISKAKEEDVVVIQDIHEESDDNGTVRLATVQVFGDVTHTFLERTAYQGIFRPHYYETQLNAELFDRLPNVGLKFIDHFVGNQTENTMNSVKKWYESVLSFHKFWSIDDKYVSTEYTNWNSTVVANADQNIKVVLTEPVAGNRKSQIQEFVDYNGSAGIQHIALYSDDIVESLKSLKSRGTVFNTTPETYYSQMREKLKTTELKIVEDMDVIEDLNVLIDYDDCGYLLQIFTKPIQDRPTLFFEIIQRHNHNGFGAGNVKALYEAIEAEQKLRGNLF